MRLTRRSLAGLKDWSTFHWKKQWEQEGRFWEKEMKIPQALLEKGVKIEDATNVGVAALPRWCPPVPDDPRWIEEVPLTQRPDWKDEPSFSFNYDTQMYEGVKQACLVAKAQHFEGSPESVDRLVGAVETPHRDLLLQRGIMLSQVWHTDNTHLPARKAPPSDKFVWRYRRMYNFGISPTKSCQILLRSLLRLCKSHTSEFPALERRRHLFEPMFQSYVMIRDKPIIQRQSLDCLITSDTWLPPFADAETTNQSAGYKIPDMWPVLPTVDFVETNNYDMKSCTGLSSQLPAVQTKCVPHTIVQIPRDYNWDLRSYDWTDSQQQASQILTCLMYTATLARQRYGPDVRVLPEPISIQHVSLLPDHFLLTHFQLNTLDLDSDVGVKNLVWTRPRSQLFEKHHAQPWVEEELDHVDHMREFDGQAFEPFLAAYLNGSTGSSVEGQFQKQDAVEQN